MYHGGESDGEYIRHAQPNTPSPVDADFFGRNLQSCVEFELEHPIRRYICVTWRLWFWS
jgi:hypothetical protein